jgi:hypothetical protein
VDRHAAERAPTFRFTRMGPVAPGRQLAPETLRAVAKRMTGPFVGPPDSQVPAGYTYFGQFMAHDLSFDLTEAGLGMSLTDRRLVQARSPALDLDSLYGDGPRDESLRFYEGKGPLLRTGRTGAAGGLGPLEGHDLPREQRLAVIADPRNDDNLAVAQLHAAFIRLHNRVVGEQGCDFEAARALVTRHFQWLVWHDYLPRICDPKVLDHVRKHGRSVFDPGADPRTPPEMPLEFSAAAFRLGHSMVRSVYAWNARHDDPPLTLDDLFRFAARGGNLGGHDELPSTHVADFRRLFDMRDAGLPEGPGPLLLARKIDVRLTNPLQKLPPGTFGESAPPADAIERNLAFRNLMRARMVELATGQDMAAKFEVPALDAGAIGGDDGMGAALGARGLEHTPLWVYVLREAEHNGNRLAGAGARIVAETIHRAIEGSRVSFFRDDPDWRPALGANKLPYSVAHLLLYAAGDDPVELSPAD